MLRFQTPMEHKIIQKHIFLTVKCQAMPARNKLFTVWNWVVSDIVDCNSMFYVTKPVFKHTPRAAVGFCLYSNSSDKILAIKFRDVA